MTVENLRLQRLQNLEHYRFAKNVLTLCRTANIAKLNPKLPELEKAIEMEDLALNPPVANELTPQVIALDEERDRAYQALMSRVRSYAFDEDSKLRNAAARIEDVAARYGNVIRMNYDKETAAIENFLTDLKGENIRPLVTKLGVTALVDRLEKNNKAFADFFLRRLSTDQRGKYDVKALRAETDRTLVAVVRRMDSIDDMEPSPEIRALIELYNRLVANRRALLARRASYGEAAVEKRRAEIAEMLRPPARPDRGGEEDSRLCRSHPRHGQEPPLSHHIRSRERRRGGSLVPHRQGTTRLCARRRTPQAEEKEETRKQHRHPIRASRPAESIARRRQQ
ncbi:DUF6261 family protein [Porphyromonas gingivalis]|uniref:DUF6261 family protein n=1 Tax=Porphyromonas gingivalis TaxID=837 RepID=UPI001E600D4D|nr:DUF6261 family protein [Porphyromonas gingivalis]